jgi:hypothetical protein
MSKPAVVMFAEARELRDRLVASCLVRAWWNWRRIALTTSLVWGVPNESLTVRSLQPVRRIPVVLITCRDRKNSPFKPLAAVSAAISAFRFREMNSGRCLSLKFGRDTSGFTPAAVEVLLTYNWPDNIRGLKNMIEAAFMNLDPDAGHFQLRAVFCAAWARKENVVGI